MRAEFPVNGGIIIYYYESQGYVGLSFTKPYSDSYHTYTECLKKEVKYWYRGDFQDWYSHIKYEVDSTCNKKFIKEVT
ncbi:hypothetical protein VPHG_00176 [Vibrio phage 11895-B1]|uniref:hypothetical protein n=1 Tax=Vibrio phage 11895-B1 TaxID=754075 RepID=UPI0002C056B6|nr:hypothetical protein VPHG_00176 [Vibrio phage 11895-B1]AGH32239.1 hypothetical protein VPHG_00176 [Vibrio phage 11895-B1]